MVKLMFVLTSLLSVIPCQAEVIVYFPMDSNPNWTTEGQWEFGVPQGGGGPESYDPTSGYTGSNVYGYNLAGNYENDMPEYCLTTSALNCALAENVKLSFWRWLGVESSLFDHARIQVSNNHVNWTDVWVNGEDNLSDTSWVYCEYDTSAIADRQPTVFIRWCMGPTDFSNAYAGWNIDDVCLNGDVLDPFFISPNDVFFSLGPEGGPFIPACKSYTLTNEGTSALNWTAEGTQSWLDVTPGSGTLIPGASVAVEICINSTADTLAEGKYTDTVSFTNTNSGFSHLIDVVLYVAEGLCVPVQFPTIQAAINASSNGDTIVVLDGTYTGNGNRDIDFNGREVTLKSVSGPESCIINCQGNVSNPHRGFYFHSSETPQSVVDGFTVTGGWVEGSGGGIYCTFSSPTITNCVISGNRGGTSGGGIFCKNNSSPVITNCIIIGNRSFTPNVTGAGGGMYNDNSSPILTNTYFSGNSSPGGGGMYNYYSNPILTNCTFNSNSATILEGSPGGGMYNYYSNPILTNCTFKGNRAYYGAGMYNYNCKPTLANCAFNSNSVIGFDHYGGLGGGMYNTKSSPILSNCTFAGNEAVGGYGLAGGMYNSTGKPRLTNCIFWGNIDDGGMDESAQIYSEGVGGPFINYGCIQGLDIFAGNDNIGEDPCFADSSNDDYHLKSVAGRWDANSESWVQDAVTSPCIDAGDPNSDWTKELWPHGKRINMGAYGGTPEASMSLLEAGNIADLNFDGLLCSKDTMLLMDKWLCKELLLTEDLSRDGFVNFADYAIFAHFWELPARNPNPADGAIWVSATANLSWAAGVDAISHDVYFGTSDPPPFIGNQADTTFDPGTMDYSTKYYWRIDEVNSSGKTTGTVWSFWIMISPPSSPPK